MVGWLVPGLMARMVEVLSWAEMLSWAEEQDRTGQIQALPRSPYILVAVNPRPVPGRHLPNPYQGHHCRSLPARLGAAAPLQHCIATAGTEYEACRHPAPPALTTTSGEQGSASGDHGSLQRPHTPKACALAPECRLLWGSRLGACNVAVISTAAFASGIPHFTCDPFAVGFAAAARSTARRTGRRRRGC